MTLRDEWQRLDSDTRKWLLDNAGCVLAPSTITAVVQQNSERHIDVDRHGQMILSREDLDFIREKGTGVGAGQVNEEFQFNDATQRNRQLNGQGIRRQMTSNGNTQGVMMRPPKRKQGFQCQAASC